MYSRFQDRRDVPLRLPENYGGCAFSPAPKPLRDLPPGTPPPAVEPPPLSEEHAKAPSAPDAPSSPDVPPPPPPESASPTAFLQGRSYDDVLLLGTILLLWRNAEDSDVLPFLLLLLFCG